MNGEFLMTNDEAQLTSAKSISSFGLRHSFVIRRSSFVI